MQAWETWHEAVAMVVSRGRRSCADAKPVPVTSRPFIATYTTVLQPRQRSPVAVPAAAAAEAQPQPEAPAVPDTVITIREEDPAAATQADSVACTPPDDGPPSFVTAASRAAVLHELRAREIAQVKGNVAACCDTLARHVAEVLSSLTPSRAGLHPCGSFHVYSATNDLEGEPKWYDDEIVLVEAAQIRSGSMSIYLHNRIRAEFTEVVKDLMKAWLTDTLMPALQSSGYTVTAAPAAEHRSLALDITFPIAVVEP